MIEVNEEKYKKTTLETHPEIPHSRAETKKAPSEVLSPESKLRSPTWPGYVIRIGPLHENQVIVGLSQWSAVGPLAVQVF
jgi:hypothetical protein